MKDVPFNILGERYASERMVNIWSPRNRIRQERQLWLAALRGMKKLGRDIPSEAIESYEKAVDDIDLAWIAAREKATRHDVKAKIEAFNNVAGGRYELVHQGFTSRDLTDNVEQMLISESIEFVLWKTAAVLYKLSERAEQYTDLAICARTHNVPAQATTFGKRLACYAEEVLIHAEGLSDFHTKYALRGIKGPSGTQQDMLDLLGRGDALANNAERLEWGMAEHLGFENVLGCVGQVYPRSLDFVVVSKLYALAAGPSNFALMVRLMAGQELMHEGFGKEQSGSSAMPHKMNSRTSERINSCRKILLGNLMTAADLSGDQWYEGDVSCSAARRIIFPDAFFCIDGIYESMLTVLGEMQVYDYMVEKELKEYLPYLSTTKLLMALLKKNAKREEAHLIIKKAALEGLRGKREGGGATFESELCGSGPLDFTPQEFQDLTSTPDVGLAQEQTKNVCIRARQFASQFEGAATYLPEPIL